VPVTIRTIPVSVYTRAIRATVVMRTIAVAIDARAIITPLPSMRLLDQGVSLPMGRVFS
jgi:hypothetical protein